MSAPLRLGIAGLGTVGSGTLKTLLENADIIEQRCGRPLQVVAISGRDRKRDRGVDISNYQWVDDPVSLARNPDVDVVVELIGGSEGVAKALCETALANGKPVVTANKALIAHHGIELAALAERHKVMLAFEAAVAGGIPIIKALRDGLSANRFSRVVGILNGTCNYILTSMAQQHREFADVLEEAQKLGYAEADPSFDVDGIDTAHKLAIITSLAFGTPVNVDAVHIEGIRNITMRDMEFARELGYSIKLLGIATETDGGIMQRVHPCMVPADSSVGSVHGVFNAVVAEGNAVGRMIFEGRGAGAGPTASAVVADIIDIARGVYYYPFVLPSDKLRTLPASPISEHKGSYYLRLAVLDKPGVLADVTTLCKEEGISLRSFLQRSHRPGEAVQVVMTTHLTQESAMLRALSRVATLDSVLEPPHMIRIETL